MTNYNKTAEIQVAPRSQNWPTGTHKTIDLFGEKNVNTINDPNLVHLSSPFPIMAIFTWMAAKNLDKLNIFSVNI